jgi:4-hydroxythreonine-4-phosphate dehydrogenase
MAMYHDQGLIPFKALAGSEGVNYTAGLSKVRTSPDHGTAYDIAGKDRADEQSMRQAIFMAREILLARREYEQMRANPVERVKISGEYER